MDGWVVHIDVKTGSTMDLDEGRTVNIPLYPYQWGGVFYANSKEHALKLAQSHFEQLFYSFSLWETYGKGVKKPRTFELKYYNIIKMWRHQKALAYTPDLRPQTVVNAALDEDIIAVAKMLLRDLTILEIVHEYNRHNRSKTGQHYSKRGNLNAKQYREAVRLAYEQLVENGDIHLD